MAYKKENIIRISWKQFDFYLKKIKEEIEKYLEENNLKIDFIVPILRGGGIPGLKLAFDLKIIKVFPCQYKYFYYQNKIRLKKINQLDVNNLIGIRKNPVVLVVEGNHSTGHIAKKAISDIKRKKPNAKIIYACIAKDYFYKDSVKGVVFSTHGLYTNENRKLSKEECQKLKIKHDKVFIFPWENIKEEISSLNGESFNYIDC